MQGRWFVARAQEQKNPVIWCLQGVGDDVDMVGGWHGCQYGREGVPQRCKGGVVGFVARVDENEETTL